MRSWARGASGAIGTAAAVPGSGCRGSGMGSPDAGRGRWFAAPLCPRAREVLGGSGKTSSWGVGWRWARAGLLQFRRAGWTHASFKGAACKTSVSIGLGGFVPPLTFSRAAVLYISMPQVCRVFGSLKIRQLS